MTLPVGLPTIAVSGGEVYRLSDGSLPSSLRVVLTASVPAIVWDGKTVVMDPYILDAASGVGTVSGSVPPTNHPDVAPQGFTYSVAEWVNGKPFRTAWTLSVPYDGGAVDLDSEAPVTVIAGTPTAVGPPPDLTIGTVTTLDTGEPATAEISGTTPDLVLNLGIPRGSTVAVGTVTTGAPGSSATVTNVGTDADVVLDFTIPRGDTGAVASVDGQTGNVSLSSTYEAKRGADDYYVTGAEKTALHSHKARHATGGADALSPADIGAATAEQGAKADLVHAATPILTNLVQNGDFSDGTAGFGSNTPLTAEDGVLISTGTGGSVNPNIVALLGSARTSGIVLYVRFDYKIHSAACYKLSVWTGTLVHDLVAPPIINTWATASTRFTLTATRSAIPIYHYYGNAADSNGAVLEMDNVTIIDLTAAFGAGNEPSKEQMDVIMDSLGGWFNGSKAVPTFPLVSGLGSAATTDATDYDPAGTAAAAVSAHEAAADPHPGYTTPAEAAAAAPVQSVDGQTGAVSLSSTYEPLKGADDNYVTDAEKLALHSHANKTALDAVSGTNTGDQDLSGLAPRTALYLPGVAGNNVSCPDSPGVSVAGDIDVRCRVYPADWTPTANATLASKYAAAGNRSWWFFHRTDASLGIYYSADGTAVASATGVPITGLADGQGLWVRFTLDIDNGAGGTTTRFYRSDDGATWTQIGADIVHAGAGALFDSTAPIEIGSREGGTLTMFTGAVQICEIRSGIDGTVVARWDGRSPHTRQRDAYGNIWTVNGTANAWEIV